MKSATTSDRFVEYHKLLRKAMRVLLPARGLALIDDDGRVRWTDRFLVIAAVLMAWSPASRWRDAFAQARDILIAMYPTRRRPGSELSGFLRTLQKRGDELLQRVTAALRARTQQLAGAAFRWKGWVLIGADGSRINCPRTQANEAGLGCAGKTRTAPQLLLLTLFHVATGLPWAWRRTRGDGSERAMLLELLSLLPVHTLLLADAGFVGYALLWALQNAGHAFVIRAGRNVTLLRKLGFEVQERRGTVYLWPQGQRKEPPLVLRLVEIKVGPKRIALLTNLLDEAALSDAELLSLYRQRWGIEVLYRSLKQTMDKHTLRAETPAAARCELDWALVGLWMLGLMAQQAGSSRKSKTQADASQASQTSAGASPKSKTQADASPKSKAPAGASPKSKAQDWSPAEALRVVHQVLRDPRRRVGARRLSKLLRAARRDAYVRKGSKTARNWPHKKTESPPGVPKVRMATKAEIAEIRALLDKRDAA